MNNIISFDTEFNNNGDILSLGLFNKQLKKDFYFKNKVDKYSQKIHLLEQSFIDKQNKFNPSLVESNLTNFKYMLGFDCLKDLNVLKIKKVNSLYSSLRIIDMKDVLFTLGFQDISVFKMSILLNITDIHLHIASNDSKIVFLFMEKLINVGEKHFVDKDTLIQEMAQITKDSREYQSWYLESENYIIKSLKDSLLNELSLTCDNTSLITSS